MVRHLVPAVILAIGAIACARHAEPDAYGNVEAVDVVVGAEGSGRLTAFGVEEGATLAAQAVVGSIDSTELALARDQLVAQRGANASRVVEVTQQIDVLGAQQNAATAQRDVAKAQRSALEAQLAIAKRTYDRTKRLFDQQAATAQQLDQAERDYRTLEEQVKAQDHQVQAQDEQIRVHAQQIDAARAQRQTAEGQVAASDAQVAQAGERIRKTQITNPIAGTVLTTYARAGEVVQTGQPLYRIADLRFVDVRAYVSEPQLAGVRLGAPARVSIDVGRAERREVSGTVSWVSSQAEFTPTPIQTRDERASLVYAVKIRVANDGGLLKIGMPADVQFAVGGGAR